MAETTTPKKKIVKPRAAADLVRKEGSLRAKFAEGPKKPVKTPGMKPGQKKLMDTLNKSRVANATARSAATAEGGAARLGLGRMLGIAGRVAGPVGALVGMTRPAGEGSDKPSGPLMAGNRKMRERIGDMGVRKATNKFGPGVKLTKLEVIDDSPKASAPKKAGAPKKVIPVPKAKPSSSFKGNWKYATPTEMQARGGARVKRRSLADLLKKK